MSKIGNINAMPFKTQSPQTSFPQYNQGYPQVNKEANFPKAPSNQFSKTQQNPNPNQYSEFKNPYINHADEEGYSTTHKYNPYSKTQPTNQDSPNAQVDQYQYNHNQQGKRFEVIDNAYSNPNQNSSNSNGNANQSNDIYSQYNQLYGETGVSQQRSFGSNVTNFFTRVWDKTKETTLNIKDKYNDSKFGQSLNTAGHKSVEGMKVAGYKIKETGNKVVVSNFKYITNYKK